MKSAILQKTIVHICSHRLYKKTIVHMASRLCLVVGCGQRGSFVVLYFYFYLLFPMKLTFMLS